MDRESAWQVAYKWLCNQRKNAHSGSEAWHQRFHCAADGEAFSKRVEKGEYRLKSMRMVKRAGDDPIAMWGADDALVLKLVPSKRRWPLRRTIHSLNEQMKECGFALYPDKTQIGRLEKGFDWMGLLFDEADVRRSPRSLQMLMDKTLRLYEQNSPVKNIMKKKSATAKAWKLASALCTFSIVSVSNAATYTLDFGTISYEAQGSQPTHTLPSPVPVAVIPGGEFFTLLAPNDSVTGRDYVCLGPALVGIITSGVDRLSPSVPIRPTVQSYGALPISYTRPGSICGDARLGPFSTSIPISRSGTATGPAVDTDTLNITGTLVGFICPAIIRTLDFGSVYAGQIAGSQTVTVSSNEAMACPTVSYNESLAPILTATSLRSTSEYFLPDDPAMPAVGVSLSVGGTEVKPGVAVPGLISRGPLSITGVLRGLGPVLEGAFSITIQTTYSYP